jgi:hypothetical protein
MLRCQTSQGVYMDFLFKGLSLYLVLIALSATSHANSDMETYQDLQSLKTDVRAAYVNALIVDKDSRAHPERIQRLENIEIALAKIDTLKQLEPSQRSDLSVAIRVYLRSAKNEAATYDVNLGSRTLSNGYSAYSELIEKIYSPIQTLEMTTRVQKKSLSTFQLMDEISQAVELHGERTIKTERAENLTQTDLNKICTSIERGLNTLSQYSDAKSTLKKATLKWSFIKTPICQLSKTSAPYTITHYGSWVIDTLKLYAEKNLVISKQ